MKATKYSRLHLGIILALLLAITFSAGFLIGGKNVAASALTVEEGKVIGLGTTPKRINQNVNFDHFWDVWSFVEKEFYKQPVEDKDLFYGALKGLLSGTDDEYTVYFDPEEASQFKASLEGSFEGIGAEIDVRDDRLQIVAPLRGSPAEGAGILAGDWIVEIDGNETQGITLEGAVSVIRGEKGTPVVLTVARKGASELMQIEIIRDKIVVDSVRWELNDENIMEISISTFNEDTPALFSNAVQETLAADVDGIILDLRNNPGGLLTSAIDVAAAWVGYQPVVLEKQQQDTKTYNGPLAARLNGIKTIVIVNGGSASGSEIVAGALQDHGLAQILGTQTFGKGSVQDYRTFNDGSALKITTAEWYTPNGRSINKRGVTPTIEVKVTPEDIESQIDPQHQAAIQVIQDIYDPIAQTKEEEAVAQEAPGEAQ